MKQNLAVFLIAAVLTLTMLFAPNAQAGDDPATQVTLSADAGAGAECTGALKPKTHYAVQPLVNAYVRVTSNTTAATATSTSVRIDANKLYDVWTTSTQVYICAKPVAAGAASSFNVFLYREGRD